MNEFKVGDLVKVVDWGQQYSTHQDWFLAHMNNDGFKIEWAIRYAFSNALFEIKSLGDSAKLETYRVLYMDGVTYLISSIADTQAYQPVYLFNESGLKRPPRKMTKADIEKELGYEIEIWGVDWGAEKE